MDSDIDLGAIAEKICEGTTLKPRQIEVFGCDGVNALVKHHRQGNYQSRAHVELFNLESRHSEKVLVCVRLSSSRKAKLIQKYLIAKS